MDSHPFAVTFRTDNPHANDRVGVYEQAIALSALIDAVIEGSEARFYLKDMLDRSSTTIALRIAHAAGEHVKESRRRSYLHAQRAATDCAAVLDILTRRAKKPHEGDLIAPARALVVQLVAQLALLATR